MSNLLTESSELNLRQAFEDRDRALAHMASATAAIREIITKQVSLHGAKQVVDWLQSRSPLQIGAGITEHNFFDYIINEIGRGVGSGRFSAPKGSLARALCDAADNHKKMKAGMGVLHGQ